MAIHAIRDKEYAEFLEAQKELSEATEVIDRSINILEKNMREKGSSALLQANVNVKDASKLIKVLNTVLDGLAISFHDKQRLQGLIQEHAADVTDTDSQAEDKDAALV